MSIDCKINKENFIAGETLKLLVSISAENEKKRKQHAGANVTLTVKGEEFGCVHWSDNSTEDHFERKAHPLFFVEEDLVTFGDEGIKQGNHEYPFEFKLPEDLPSSFEVSNGYSYCKIVYKVEIVLEATGFFSQDTIYELPFNVKAAAKPPPAVFDRKFLQPDTQNISFCCCFDRGSMTLGCALNKTVVTQHDNLIVGFVAENNSTVAISDMEVTLFQKIETEVRWKKNTKRETLAQQVFKADTLPGAGKVDRVDKTLNPEVINANLFQVLKSNEDPKKLYVTFLIRPDIMESYVGKLIRVYHEIELKLMTPEMYTNPELWCSIKVLPSAESVTNQFSEPPSVLNPNSDVTVSIVGKALREETIEDEKSTKAEDISREKFITPTNSSRRLQKSGIFASQKNISSSSFSVSYKGILDAMDETYEDLTLIEKYLKDESLGYRSILLDLTSEQYGTIVTKVNFTFDQSVVAEILAKELSAKFTCKYVASACRLASESNRADIVKSVCPYVTDLTENRHLIDDCLSSFDKIILEDFFDKLHQEKSRP